MPSRELMYRELMSHMLKQVEALPPSMRGMVEILSDGGTDITTGEKRNVLLRWAKGDYIIFHDDDDFCSIDYVLLILQACLHNTDSIGITGTMTTNGRNEEKWFVSKDYDSWYKQNGVYYRSPTHISPVRRSIALQAMFPDVTIGEDAEYSKRLLPLIKTEVNIDQPIYHYRFVCEEPKKQSHSDRLRLARLKQRR